MGVRCLPDTPTRLQEGPVLPSPVVLHPWKFLDLDLSQLGSINIFPLSDCRHHLMLWQVGEKYKL